MDENKVEEHPTEMMENAYEPKKAFMDDFTQEEKKTMMMVGVAAVGIFVLGICIGRSSGIKKGMEKGKIVGLLSAYEAMIS